MYNDVFAYHVLLNESLEHAYKRWDDRLIAYMDQFRKALPEVTSGLFQMIVGNLGKQVVDLVGADVVCDLVAPAVVAIHGADLTFDILPLRVCIPGDLELRVVQEGDDHQVGRGDEHRRRVVIRQTHHAERLRVAI